jgi:hypothetical protein
VMAVVLAAGHRADQTGARLESLEDVLGLKPPRAR